MKYAFICSEYNGFRAVLSYNRKWGFVDKNDKLTVPFIYDEVNHFDNGLAIVGNCHNTLIRMNYGIIDTTGKENCPLKYTLNEIEIIKKQFIRKQKLTSLL